MPTEYMGDVDCKIVTLSQFRCQCGLTFYAKPGDAEVKSCGHERARLDPSSFVAEAQAKINTES